MESGGYLSELALHNVELKSEAWEDLGNLVKANIKQLRTLKLLQLNYGSGGK